MTKSFKYCISEKKPLNLYWLQFPFALIDAILKHLTIFYFTAINTGYESERDWLVSFTRDLSRYFSMREHLHHDHEVISNSHVRKAYLSFLLESVNSLMRFFVDLLSTTSQVRFI